MNRRTFLRASGVVGTAALAGCTGMFETRSVREPPLADFRPNAVYLPTHAEGMEMVGMGKSGDYQFALMYSYPHRFWNMNEGATQRTDAQSDDSVHLMATVWDPETGVVLPETGLSVEIDGEEEVIYPMLAQQMGFHYGDNMPLSGDGTYTATISVGGINIRRTGAFQDKFGDPASVDIDFEFSQSKLEELPYRLLEDEAGNRGALEPMNMEMMPNGTVPAKDDLPGTLVGEATSGDAVFLATLLSGDEVPAGIDGDAYLALSARTPYNQYVIPAMGLSGTLSAAGETVSELQFTRTLDPALNYHYGALVDADASWDELGVTVDIVPQVARHEGYETAFIDMEPMTFQRSS
ncbi:twin-arginine translocation signal domain-containing protein [Haladaptatus sp. DYSN1]|uniref:twin-arginine translocation signal domain-containing protein n=1 Tax=unclassified Haladaptatus TaxID=2622732 RepID=UPI002405EF74|nr:twin-arginine translocation signal domain-containing protein [Haladaptatus sp. DYSN1]